MSDADPALRTVDRTLHLLEVLASNGDGWSLAEVCRATGYHKSTALRMLATLERHSYVVRESPGGRYRLGSAPLVLAGAVQLRLRDIAHPRLKALADETGETAQLHILNGLQALCIDKADSPEPIRVAYDVGRSGPLYAGSAGKVLLAFLAPEERESILEQIELKQFTPLTITDRAELLRNLDESRRFGYVETFGEFDAGVYGVGVPISNAAGRLEAGLVLVGPADRWTSDRRVRYRTATLAAARDISYELGFRDGRGAA